MTLAVRNMSSEGIEMVGVLLEYHTPLGQSDSRTRKNGMTFKVWAWKSNVAPEIIQSRINSIISN